MSRSERQRLRLEQRILIYSFLVFYICDWLPEGTPVYKRDGSTEARLATHGLPTSGQSEVNMDYRYART
jgi:hypothetical protein